MDGGVWASCRHQRRSLATAETELKHNDQSTCREDTHTHTHTHRLIWDVRHLLKQTDSCLMFSSWRHLDPLHFSDNPMCWYERAVDMLLFCLWGYQRRKCLGPPLPPLCSRLVWTRPASAYPHFVWLWFCFFTIQRLTPLTFTPLNCWYHWPTHSTSAASRPSSWVLTPASVKWCTGAWLWSRRAREATLYIYSLVNLFLCSAHIHHHILPLALSLSINHRITMNILKVAVWLKISERCCWCACTPLWLLLTILRPIGGLQSPLSITPLAWHSLTEVIPTQSTVTDLYRNKRNNLIKSYHAVEN